MIKIASTLQLNGEFCLAHCNAHDDVYVETFFVPNRGSVSAKLGNASIPMQVSPRSW